MWTRLSKRNLELFAKIGYKEYFYLKLFAKKQSKEYFYLEIFAKK